MGGPARQRTATQPAAGSCAFGGANAYGNGAAGWKPGAAKRRTFPTSDGRCDVLPLYGAKRRTRRRNAAECDVLHDFLRTCPSMLAVAVTRAASKLTPARASSEA